LQASFNNPFRWLWAFQASSNNPIRRFWDYQASSNNPFRGYGAFGHLSTTPSAGMVPSKHLKQPLPRVCTFQASCCGSGPGGHFQPPGQVPEGDCKGFVPNPSEIITKSYRKRSVLSTFEQLAAFWHQACPPNNPPEAFHPLPRGVGPSRHLSTTPSDGFGTTRPLQTTPSEVLSLPSILQQSLLRSPA